MAKWSESEKPWERRKDESTQAFEAFKTYLDMGEGRSLRRVEQALNKSHALIGRWSSRYEWMSRIREYENELRRQEYEVARKERKKMQQRQIQTSVLLQKKAVEALSELDPKTLSAKDILAFISQGAKLEAGLRTDSVGEAARDSGNDGTKATLADAIIEAYRKRKEAE